MSGPRALHFFVQAVQPIIKEMQELLSVCPICPFLYVLYNATALSLIAFLSNLVITHRKGTDNI